MPTMAALPCALPLAIGAGTGAEMRRPLGIAIVGGLLFSQMLTLFTTPVVYLYLDLLRVWLAPARARAPGSGAAAALACALCAVLAACSVGPDYERPALDVPGKFKSATA